MESIQSIIDFLQKKLKQHLYILPVETYKNSRESGHGVRVIVGDTKRSFRVNLKGSTISGVDVWDGTDSDPVAHIAIESGEHHIVLSQLLPLIAAEIAHPTVGDQEVIVTETVFNQEEFVITEASRKWTPDLLARLAVEYIQKNPERVSKVAFGGMAGGYNNAGVIDVIIGMYPDLFEKSGKSIQFIGSPQDLNIDDVIRQVQSKSVTIMVEPGGKNETYGASAAEEAVPDDIKRVPYEEQLTHLEALVKATAKGAANALFVGGKGGTGKTFTVEKVLENLGLKDGQGYYKQTGSSSAIGIYATLYNNRKGIILFDDCDGALADQDARNIIKAAADTRKDRKLAWGKRSSMMYDPDTEEVDPDLDGIEKFPRYFYFTGKIIFISNLSMTKLDPDGALATRAFLITIDPTETEMYDFMEKILPKIQPDAGSLTDEEKREVMEVVRASSRKDGISLRKLIRSLNLAATGVPNWKDLVSLYA